MIAETHRRRPWPTRSHSG